MTVERIDPGKVLVVEDDPSLAELYAEWLGESYTVETVYDGAGALERLDGTVGVVLLDRLMSGRSGDEVLDAIRTADVDPQVVMVSAVTPDVDIVQMGFDAYLEKPVDAATLNETVDRMVTRAEYDERLQELFSLIERQTTLEAVKRPEELEASEEYLALTDRVEAARADVDSLLTELSDEDFRVAVERLQRTAAERTSEQRYESLTEDVLDSSREATVVIDADGSVVWANEATEPLLGFDRNDVRGRPYAAVAADQLQDIDAGDQSLASLIRTGLESYGHELDATVHVPDAGEKRERWLEYRSAPIETGLYAGGRIEHYYDVTRRYRREQYLKTLHRATRELMAAETADAAVEQAVATATTELDFSYAAVFTRDRETGDLVPAVSETTDPDVDPSLPTLSGGSDPVWAVFVDRADRLAAATHREQSSSGGWLDDAFDDWVLCPLGRQGVFLVGMTAGESLSTTELDLAETWAENTRQALAQIARTRDLRSRDRELQRQNERLSRLNRINRLIRSITPAVVSAETRAEIEREVCNRLLRIDPVSGAWIADVDLPTDETVCRAAAGTLDGYLSALPATASGTIRAQTAEVTEQLPARQAYETLSPVSVTDLLRVDPNVWWRERGLKRGTNAIVAIPITHESMRFGALEVHVDSPRGMSDEEIEALEELGQTIGHAIGAIRQRDALLAGGTTRLTFDIGSDSVLSEFATTTDLPFRATDLSRRDDGTCAVFVTLDLDDRHDAESIERRVEATTDASVIQRDATRLTCVLTLGAASPIQQLIRRGGALQQIGFASDSQRLTATVQLSSDTAVREYVEDVTEAADDIELTAKYDQSVDWETESTLATALDDRMTDRQRETLRMAFHAGYFDWPRDSDAATVAAELGIAQSTFSQHLRTAERKLLEELFS